MKVIRIRLSELCKLIAECMSEQIYGRYYRLDEMATIGAQKWGDREYLIQIHGKSTKDRDVPHIHIYLIKDHVKKRFNFEISLIDLLSKDEITLIYQLDREKRVRHTNRKYCDWTGYKDECDGLRDFLFGNVQVLHYATISKDNLDVAIYAWNIETDMIKTQNGGNPMKEWLDQHNIVVLPKYQKCFEPKNLSQNIEPQEKH